MLAALLGFTAAAALLTVTPGLDTALVVRTATAKGPRAGAAAAVGIAGGLLVWGVGAAVGLAALLSASALAFRLLKWAGAAYLIFLGLRMLLRPQGALRAGNAAAPGGGVWTSLRTGLFTNLLNPKVGVFYVSFLPPFIPAGVNVAGFSILLAGIHAMLELLWFGLLIAMTAPLSRLLSRGGFVRWLDRVTGCVFAGLGLRLAFLDVR